MNNIQKSLLIVFSMSIVIFAISAYHFNTYLYLGMGSYFGGAIKAIGVDDAVFRTNWLGMIAFGSAIASIVGFFLFKDKK